MCANLSRVPDVGNIRATDAYYLLVPILTVLTRNRIGSTLVYISQLQLYLNRTRAFELYKQRNKFKKTLK